MFTELTPSYGRTYKSKAAVQADWDAGKDFTIQDVTSPWDGKQINKGDAEKEGGTFNIRYNNNRSVAVITVAKKVK
jgi:hypothetical protein